FIGPPETWIACAHHGPRAADIMDSCWVCKKYWPVCRRCPETGPSHCTQTGQPYVSGLRSGHALFTWVMLLIFEVDFADHLGADACLDGIKHLLRDRRVDGQQRENLAALVLAGHLHAGDIDV